MRNKNIRPHRFNYSFFHNNEEIVCGISHLWRQPLTVFSFGLMSLKKRIIHDKKSLEVIKKLNEQLKYMSSVLELYQEFYTPSYTKEYFDIYERSEVVKEIIRPIMEINQIEFNIEVRESFIIYGYRYLFEQQLLESIYKVKKLFHLKNTINPSITIIIDNPKILVISNSELIAEQSIQIDSFSSRKSEIHKKRISLF